MTPTHPANRPHHFLDLAEFSGETLRALLSDAAQRKAVRREAGLMDRRGMPDPDMPLQGRVLALIFEQVSTRTRISFDMAMRQLGGQTMFLTGAELQLGRGESIADTARVMSRYVDGIMIRILSHDMISELAAHAEVPVINGLTRFSHPCQIMADVMTYEEYRGPITGARIAWVGDVNNVCRSWVQAAARLNFSMVLAAPAACGPDAALMAFVERSGADVTVTDDPRAAVDGAHAVVTDTWVSLGDEDAAARSARLAPYQVTETLMAQARPDALFLHCLPAHRGNEMTPGVIDGPQSVVWDEAENRLHAQKAILAWCMA